MTKSSKFIEYMKLHLLSLEQDLEVAFLGEGYESLNGQIIATSHLLSVALDIMEESERV